MCRFCTHQRMNGLLTAMAVANPAITALLTIIIFLEKDKLQKRSEAIEAAIKYGNASVVQTIEAQKQNFINIADRLEALSKDSERSAATFIGLSTALTDSSAVSAKALGGVTQGLQTHAAAVTELVTDLSTKMSATSATAISELSKKSAEALAMVADQVNRVELAQVASKEASTQAISELTLKNTNLSTNLSDTFTTSINGLSNMLAGAIETAVELVTRVETAQVASQEASTQAITDLARKTAESLKQVADEIKRIEAAQGEAAKTSAESVAKLTQEVGQTSKSIKELQETLKSTVSL